MGSPGSRPGRAPAPPPDGIDGPALVRALAGGAAALAQQADAIDAVNVFPVPDGDTGTNMSLTMRAACESAARVDAASVRDVALAAAHAALMGAKGNSGVILSQILAGLAAVPDAPVRLHARAFADGLRRGRDAAYRVVSEPREGTILTAISEAARAADARAADGAGAAAALEAAVDAAREAVARTPELLSVLKEAGVVDAGAEGLYVMLEGMLRALRGQPLTLHLEGLGRIDESWLSATQRVHGDEASGFCTEFFVSGRGLDAEAVRHRLRGMGESVLVVGGDSSVRVHLHTHAPDAALAYGRTLGVVSNEKVEDLRGQVAALARRTHAAGRRTSGPAVVAVASGAGFEELFRSLGATALVHGGRTMNPSAGEIRAAIEATGADELIVLPNNENVVLAARQAAKRLPTRVVVLPTKTVPQGVAALVAMNAEASFDENVAAMQAAIARVRTAEITRAARATRVDGRDVPKGHPIGIVDGELAVAEQNVADAVCAAVGRMIDGRDAPLVTLYYGEAEDRASASAVAAIVHAEYGCEVEVVDGGQPLYPYLVGVE